jgi:hypothetical protein
MGNQIMNRSRILAIFFLLTLAPEMGIAGARGPMLKDPPPSSLAPFVRYNGCIGDSSFSPGRQLDSARSCVNTIARQSCKITPETCCFRQCIYSFTRQVTDLERIAESPALKRLVTDAIGRKLQSDLAESRNEGEQETARPANPSDLANYYDTCVDSCTSTVKAILIGIAKKGKIVR